MKRKKIQLVLRGQAYSKLGLQLSSVSDNPVPRPWVPSLPYLRNRTARASKGQCPANVTGKGVCAVGRIDIIEHHTLLRMRKGENSSTGARNYRLRKILSCRRSSVEQIMGFSSLFPENHLEESRTGRESDGIVYPSANMRQRRLRAIIVHGRYLH
ncbi:hypothetical protein TNCV_1809151 [Trichonephila clavipes]|nr:hypothetical protein TNCV_1809151 [Trichonephila clavipes]